METSAGAIRSDPCPYSSQPHVAVSWQVYQESRWEGGGAGGGTSWSQDRESGESGSRPASARWGPEPAPSRQRARPARPPAAKSRGEAAAAGKGLRQGVPRPRTDLGPPPEQVVLTTEEQSPSPFVLGAPRGPPAARPGGLALPWLSPAAGARKRASWAWPSRCRSLATAPPRLACSPLGRGQLLGGGRWKAPDAALPRRGDLGAGPVPGRPENCGAPRLLSAAHPARPPTCSLTPRMHTPGRRRCCAPAGGRAERRARTKAARSRARRHARAHAGHTRAQPEYTCAHTPTHARTHSPSVHSVPGVRPHATGGLRSGPWHLTASVVTHFLPGGGI